MSEKIGSMKRIRRSVWLPAILALYLTGSYIYLYIEDSLTPDARSLTLVGASYLLVIALWWLNRRRERTDHNSQQ